MFRDFGALADLSIPAVIVGFLKSPVAPVAGVASIVLGVAEAETSQVGSILAVFGGGSLLILAWLANAIKNVMTKWLEAQGQKWIDMPTAAVLAEDKRSLLQHLEKFAEAAELERKEMQKFRETLAATVANHDARIAGLERMRG